VGHCSRYFFENENCYGKMRLIENKNQSKQESSSCICELMKIKTCLKRFIGETHGKRSIYIK
jgi:hypothetical protein